MKSLFLSIAMFFLSGVLYAQSGVLDDVFRSPEPGEELHIPHSFPWKTIVALIIISFIVIALKEKFKVLDKFFTVYNYIKSLLILGAIVCFIDMPLKYYTSFRFCTFIGLGCLAYSDYKLKNKIRPVVYILLAIIFNPFIRITFYKETWLIMDSFMAIILIGTIIYSYTLIPLKLRAKKGELDAQYDLGCYYSNSKHISNCIDKALYWFENAANKGHSGSQYELGQLFYTGKGVQKDMYKAAFWFEEVAKKDLLFSSSYLKWIYQDLNDIEKYTFWTEKCAERETPEKQYSLGQKFLKGDGLLKDEQKAAYWFEKAAGRGDADAQFQIGVCYNEGIGVTKDVKKAIYWLEKSVKQHHVVAPFYLSEKIIETKS